MADRIVAFDPNHPWLGGNIRGGDENTYCPPLWDFLIASFNPVTLCDVGCGEGHLIEYFRRRQIIVTGIDGLPENKFNAPPLIRDRIIIHDFQNRFHQLDHYDMVISCEFVEHVDEKYCINYFDQFDLCNTLVFTHAVPGQSGHNHVNCKDDDYWISMMKILKFKFMKTHTLFARELAGECLWNSVLIFKKDRGWENKTKIDKP